MKDKKEKAFSLFNACQHTQMRSILDFLEKNPCRSTQALAYDGVVPAKRDN